MNLRDHQTVYRKRRKTPVITAVGIRRRHFLDEGFIQKMPWKK